MTIQFKKAARSQSFLKLAIEGPSGSGKTWTALAIGTELAKCCGGELAVLDTENGSAALYAGDFDFSVFELSGDYHPQNYIDAIQAAEKAGIKVLVLDSITHEWTGPGGILDLVEKAKATNRGGNSYTLWSKFTPMHDQFIQAMVKSKLHLIVTIRSKQDYQQEQDSNGKMRITKMGLAPVQREGLDYEFSVIFDMNQENTAVVTKTRCSALAGGVYPKPGANVAGILWDWLQSGAAAQPEYASKELLQELFALANTPELKTAVKARMGKEYQVKTSQELTEQQANELIKWVSERLPMIMIEA